MAEIKSRDVILQIIILKELVAPGNTLRIIETGYVLILGVCVSKTTF